jgi:hypothetical protein
VARTVAGDDPNPPHPRKDTPMNRLIEAALAIALLGGLAALTADNLAELLPEITGQLHTIAGQVDERNALTTELLVELDEQ